jgi:molecular chaperone DnaK
MPDNELNPVLGIDLGTTFSAISRWDGRGASTYQMRGGEDSLQSAIYYDPKSGEFLVGQLAYRRGLRFPENVALGVKRQMDDASGRIDVGGKEFSPIELSAKILGRLYEDVSGQYPAGRFQSRGTVVTVPYYFKAHQCENTRKAAELADIECIGILQEPIAASLAYAWQLGESDPAREVDETILVFEVGGGTFDLTLFRLQRDRKRLLFEVLATGGDDRLGGMDFDKCLENLLLEKGGVSLEGVDPHASRIAHQKVLEQAIEAKKTLSATDMTYVTVPDVVPGVHIDTEVTRAELETAIAPYVDKIEDIVSRIWTAANVKPHEVDRVIRVGGSSRIPRMIQLLRDTIGEDRVWGNTDPALCVSQGAAMFAAFLDDRDIFGLDIEIRTRTSHALGVETAGGQFFTLIPANRKTPCEVRQVFTTDQDNMTSLDVNVYQGASRLVKDNSHVGTVNISGLPPRPKGELDIEVTFKVSEEQALSVIVEVEGRRTTATLNFT